MYKIARSMAMLANQNIITRIVIMRFNTPYSCLSSLVISPRVFDIITAVSVAVEFVEFVDFAIADVVFCALVVIGNVVLFDVVFGVVAVVSGVVVLGVDVVVDVVVGVVVDVVVGFVADFDVVGAVITDVTDFFRVSLMSDGRGSVWLIARKEYMDENIFDSMMI